MKKVLNKSIIVLSLLFLFFVGIYMGNKISYSVEIENDTERKENREVKDIFLEDISFEVKEAKASDKVYVDIKSSGAVLEGATINFTRSDGKYSLSLNVKDIEVKPYIEVPKFINTGDYIVKSVLLVGWNEDSSSISKNFTDNPKSSEDVLYKFNKAIKFIADPSNLDFDLIKSIKLNTNSFKAGSKIPVEIDYDKDIRVIRLNFTLGYNKMYSYINSLAKNPYIIIPQPIKEGEYVLDEIYVETYNYGSVSYSYEKTDDNKYLAYNTRYYVLSENSDQEVVYYNNADMSSDLISLIHTSDKIKKIELMSEDNPVISKDMFSAIKGLNKELIVHYKDVKYEFAGKDITNNKTFNATVDYKLLNKDNELSKYISDGLVVEFAANGDLPGNTKVTIQRNSLFDKAFKQDHVNIYYYNEENKSFELIKENLIIGTDEIAFDINHTSTYIITNSKIDGSKVYSGEDEKVSKNRNRDEEVKINKDNILLIIIVLLGITIVILLIVLLKNRNKDTDSKEKEVKEEKVEESSNIEEEFEDFDEEDLRENISKSNESSFDEEDE